MTGFSMRSATRDDATAMRDLLRAVAGEGDALPFQGGIDEAFIESVWLGAQGCVVACRDDALIGMYRYGANMPGRGSHVASATFLTARDARGQGIGRALVAHCLAAATAAGFRAMQFNQVLATNTAALSLYRSLGFRRVGKIPEAFAHPELGYVTAYVMYRSLLPAAPAIPSFRPG